MSKTKTSTDKTLSDYIDPIRRRLLLEARYMGACVVQIPGAWTRVGPTWYHAPSNQWITIGPGARNWGVSQGLAQLATDPASSPTWHAEGLSIAPVNLVFTVLPGVLSESEHFKRIADLTKQADAYEADIASQRGAS